MKATVIAQPDTGAPNAHYVSNRPPLRPNPLIKLPLGSVRPRGWLKRQLDLMVGGMVGRLTEISEFLKPDNGWFGGDNPGWEEQPYWFRGFHDLAVLTGDARLMEEARRWIEAVLRSQDTDGYFGARMHKRLVGEQGTAVCDLWPHMIMLDAVITHAEHTGDERVEPFMTRFFDFCRRLPDDLFMPDLGAAPGARPFRAAVWQRRRAGDMLPHLHWLYNRTGDAWLLDLAARFFRAIAPAQGEWLDAHIVNFTQRFAYDGLFYPQCGERRRLDAVDFWLRQHLAVWGQQPRGIFGADEVIQPGAVDPRQAFETCGFVEFNKNFYLLGRITGDPRWADRCEDSTLNHFPVSMTPDLKALHYLTASNQPQLDDSGQHRYRNKGRQISYSPHRLYRCCQHNVAMGWPYYAENLWQATADNGLAAWLYASCEATARVGDGADVTLEVATDYPFDGRVEITVRPDRRVMFPMYLRVPAWCQGFAVSLNGRDLALSPRPGAWVRIERRWAEGDQVRVDMPMRIGLTQWPRTGAVTVDRGPLSYSVKIGERWSRLASGTPDWPDWEVFPTTPWNYGLVVDRDRPEDTIRVKATRPPAEQPWTVDAAPIELSARGRRIPGWVLEDETVQELRPSPIRSAEPEEEITLIPLGCARLRMSCLPVIGHRPEAREWR